MYPSHFSRASALCSMAAAVLTFSTTSTAHAADLLVRIGHVAPVSGAQAHFGKDNENGARMAID